MSTSLPSGELGRLVSDALQACTGLEPRCSAVKLYLRAVAAAERDIPGPLGTAIAGVLGVAAEQRIAAGSTGHQGEHPTMLALAVRVLGQHRRPSPGARSS